MKINEILVESNDGTQEEVFHFGNKSWDVQRGYQLVKQHNIQPEMLPVEGGLAKFLGFTRTNPEWAKNAHLEDPVLLIDTGKGVLVIDGYHRIKRAKDEGVAELPGYILTKEMSDEIEIVSEGPLAKAAGAAAIAGAVGLAGNGVAHLASLNDITAQQTDKVAQAPAQAQRDLSTIDAKAQKSAADKEKKAQKSVKEYQPITGKKNEMILANVAQQHGIEGVELAAFMAQMAHESWNFGDMVENNPNIERYAKLKSLGNKNMNDAKRFIGRGFIQLTGRWNYEYYGKKIGMDLTSTWSAAHQAADPVVAAKIAVAFWKSRVQPNVTDFADVAQVTKPINPSLNGLEDRQKKFSWIAGHMGLKG